MSALDKQYGKQESVRVIFENDDLSDPWGAEDEAIDVNVSVPVSMVVHESGEIHIVVIDLARDDEQARLTERKIRFSPRAASQLLAAIGGSSNRRSAHLLLGDERPVTATLH